MAAALTWATMFVLPVMTASMGSYMICREEQDDTIKYLRLIPINEAKLTAAKMIVTFVLSVLIYLLLFIITLVIEAALHFSALYMEIVLDFLKMYLIQGAGVFFAVSPIIAIVPYIKKSYWAAVFGVSRYYETSVQELIYCIISLSLCGCLAAVLLAGLNYSQKNLANINQKTLPF